MKKNTPPFPIATFSEYSQKSSSVVAIASKPASSIGQRKATLIVNNSSPRSNLAILGGMFHRLVLVHIRVRRYLLDLLVSTR